MYEWEWLLEQVPALWTLPCLAVFGDNTGGIANVRACIIRGGAVYGCLWLWDLWTVDPTDPTPFDALYPPPPPQSLQSVSTIETFKPAIKSKFRWGAFVLCSPKNT